MYRFLLQEANTKFTNVTDVTIFTLQIIQQCYTLPKGIKSNAKEAKHPTSTPRAHAVNERSHHCPLFLFKKLTPTRCHVTSPHTASEAGVAHGQHPHQLSSSLEG